MSSSPTSGFSTILKAALAPSTDFLSIVDASDLTASVNGTNKKVTIRDLVESVTDAIETDLQLAIAALSSSVSSSLSALDSTKLNTSAFTFANIGGNAGDNTSLSTALAGKADSTHTHAISDVTNLQSSLDAKANSAALASYLPLAGGTLTGGLSGTTGIFSGNVSGANGTFNGRLIASSGYESPVIGTTGHVLKFPDITGFLNLTMGTRGTGFSDRCQLQFQPAHNMAGFAATQEGLYVAAGSLIGFSAANPKTDAPDTIAYRDAANTWGFRNGANAQRINLYGTYTDTSNYIRQSLSFTTYSGTVYAQYVAEGLGTGAVNIPFVITPRGTGAFILGPMPDGTATGGNARGANAIDLQLTRSAANQVASGGTDIAIGASNRVSSEQTGIAIGALNSSLGRGPTIAIGRNCVAGNGTQWACYIAIGSSSNSTAFYGTAIGEWCNATGIAGVAIGRGNTASGTRSSAMGYGSTASRYGQESYAAGVYSSDGDLQRVRFSMLGITTDATPTNLVLELPSTRLVLNSGRILVLLVTVSGHKSDGSQHAIYTRRVAIKRVGNTTTLIQSQIIGTDYEDNAATDVSITADDTNEALQIQVTGIAGETWRWEANLIGSEVTFGA